MTEIIIYLILWIFLTKRKHLMIQNYGLIHILCDLNDLINFDS